MSTLTVTAKGQITLRKDVLQHLGIKPGDKIELDLLPGRTGTLRAAQPKAAMADFVGLLSGKTAKIASLEEINAAAAAGWAGRS